MRSLGQSNRRIEGALYIVLFAVKSSFWLIAYARKRSSEAFVYWNSGEAKWEYRGMRVLEVGYIFWGVRERVTEREREDESAESERCGPLASSLFTFMTKNQVNERPNRTSLNGTDEWLWKQHLICIEGASLFVVAPLYYGDPPSDMVWGLSTVNRKKKKNLMKVPIFSTLYFFCYKKLFHYIILIIIVANKLRIKFPFVKIP